MANGYVRIHDSLVTVPGATTISDSHINANSTVVDVFKLGLIMIVRFTIIVTSDISNYVPIATINNGKPRLGITFPLGSVSASNTAFIKLRVTANGDNGQLEIMGNTGTYVGTMVYVLNSY